MAAAKKKIGAREGGAVSASTRASDLEPGTFDVLIVGGGIVGAALACALGESPLRVALIEADEPAPVEAGSAAQARVSAITHASKRIFARLGAWDAAAPRACAYEHMEVWDATGPGLIRFEAADLGEAALGWIVENRVLVAALFGRLAGFDNVDWLRADVEGVAFGEDRVTVRLAGGSSCHARLLVGADGADSRVRQWARLETAGWGYGQRAVVCTVRTERPHQATAWQRFLPEGPLAFLPLFDGSCSIVWSTAPEHADRLMSLDDPAFREALTRAFGARLGEALAVGPRAAFPLRLQHSQAYVKPRLALIGDAAHVVHPLAGQGANLGLLDAAALAAVLREAAGQARDPGALAHLRRYERWRKGDNLLMLAAMDGFKRLFGSPLLPLRFARNAGLSLTDAVSPLKHALARRAMGLAGDLPPLARAR